MKEYRLPGNFSSSKFISPVNEQLLQGGLHGPSQQIQGLNL